jgi:hypothetical protein
MELFMGYTVDTASDVMIYIASFMKIGTGVQAIIWFCLSNFKGSNISITDGRDV